MYKMLCTLTCTHKHTHTQVRELLKWFKGATSYDKNAVLEFPPIFESSQRAEMHGIGKKMGLAHQSSGNKNERRLMVCSNLDAIRNIQRRGGVSAVATAGAASVEMGVNRKAQLQRQATQSLNEASCAQTVAATVKQRLVDILEPYQPQGLVLDVLTNEYANVYGEPLPCDTWKRLTGAKIKPRDFVDLFEDVLAVIPGKAGGAGPRNVKDRIVLRSAGDAQPATPGVSVGGSAGGGGGGGGGGAGVSLPPHSPSIGTPKFGFEEEDDDTVGNGRQGSPVAGARGAGGAAAHVGGGQGGKGGAVKEKAVPGGGDGGGDGDRKDLLQYKEYVRQMVAHSKGRGMSATKIQVRPDAMGVGGCGCGWVRVRGLVCVFACIHAHTHKYIRMCDVYCSLRRH